MEKNSKEFKKLIYDLMCGTLVLEQCTAPEKLVVTNEYREGMKCSHLYNEMYEAKKTVCQRLESNEDKEVERIIDNLLAIGEELCMRMYDYGVYFSKEMK